MEKQNKTAVLCIHGHMGRRAQFDMLREYINIAQADIYMLLLPGHEESIENFVNSNRNDWQTHVLSEVEVLRLIYDRIIIVGHSMGGLLAIQAALDNPNGIAAIVALALPLKLKLSMHGMRVRAQSLSKYKAGEDASVSAAREMSGVKGVTVLNSVRLLSNYLDLTRLAKDTVRSLSALSVPLIALQSRNDEIVAAETQSILMEKLSQAQIILLEESNHFRYTDADTKRIAEVINSCI